MNLFSKNSVPIFLILISLLAGEILAQTSFENFSIPDGLSNADVMAIHQDRSGFLWIGTQDGLNRYDGYNFTVYKNDPGDTNSLGNNSIYMIDEDKYDNLWIATEGGLSKFNLNTYKFTNYVIDANDIIANNNLIISVLVDNENRIWAGSVRHGIMLLDQGSGEFTKVKLRTDNDAIEMGNAVAAIYQSPDNTIYAAAINYGLLVYDRSTGMFRKMRFGADDKDPFYGNLIRSIYEDSKGNLWIGNNMGLHFYERQKHELKLIELYKPGTIGGGANNPLVTGMIEDRSGTLWVTTSQHGLFSINMSSRKYEKVDGEQLSGDTEIGEELWHISLDQAGIIWVGSRTKGVYKIDYEREPFNVYRNSQTKNSLSDNKVRAICESAFYPNTFWIGTGGGGVNKFDRKSEKFETFDKFSKNRIKSNNITSLLEHDGILWVGTSDSGLYQYDLSRDNLKLIKTGNTKYNLSNNRIRDLQMGTEGHLWIATNDGLNRLNIKTGEIYQYPTYLSKSHPSSLHTELKHLLAKHQPVTALLEVPDNQRLAKTFDISEPGHFLVIGAGEGLDIWGMVDYGWLESSQGDTLVNFSNFYNSYYLNGDRKNRIHLQTAKLEPGKHSLHYYSDDSHSFGLWNATAPEDSNLWGIQVLSLTEQEYFYWDSSLNAMDSKLVIGDQTIRDLHLSSDKILWIGTGIYGLIKYDLAAEETQVFSHKRNDPGSISENQIDDIFEDENGILWIATTNGLNRFDPKSEKFSAYTSQDGLPTNFVGSIIKDDLGYFWLGTRSGLVKFDPATDKGVPAFVTYDTRDGVQGYDFWPNVAIKSSMGELFFGGNNGFNAFFPGKSNPHPPFVQITNLYLNNHVVMPLDEDAPMRKHIMRTDKIILSHDQNDFALEYAALHFVRPDKNKLAYKLEGFNEEWILDNRRYASYTNLDPGSYTFKLKGANSDGVWSKNEHELLIEVMPPWWRTIWAYASYVILFVALIFSFDRFQRYRVTQRERNIAQIREAELRAQAAEADTRAIKAENERKTHELEEARKLQLSMLPKKLPQLPNLDIAVYMQTATEVGGDYYDFHVDLDGTLTVVIGDATGHGLRAGTMVTTTKSLFSSHAANPDILYTFGEITRCIKHMEMHMLSMCLSILKIKNNKLELSAAGMPPAMLFRKSENRIDELELKGMPLGTFEDFPYQIVKDELHPGDTLLLYSDGLPELFNDKKEMFGYEQVSQVFESVANEKAEVIIDELKKAGSEWVNDSPPDDDVTFVVIKARG